jgi:hypothetical protein
MLANVAPHRQKTAYHGGANERCHGKSNHRQPSRPQLFGAETRGMEATHVRQERRAVERLGNFRKLPFRAPNT